MLHFMVRIRTPDADLFFFCDIAVNHGHVVPDFDFHGKRVREPGEDALFPEFSDFVSFYYVSSGIHLNLSQYRFT